MREGVLGLKDSPASDQRPVPRSGWENDMKREELPVAATTAYEPSDYFRIGLAVVWTTFWLLTAAVDFQEYVRGGGVRPWEPLAATATSACVATLIAVWQVRRAGEQEHLLKTPLRWFLRMWTWLPLLAVAYVAGVYVLRMVVYALAKTEFRHPPWTNVFAYELSKFILFYVLLSAVHFGLRAFSAWQGERSPQDDDTRRASDGPRVSARLTITERGHTTLVGYEEIEWLEAADNYVSLHLDGQEILVRRTLSSLLKELDDGFARTHRSAAVRLDRVAAVRPRDKGDATVIMRSGAEVPCSRQQRAALIDRMQARRADSPLQRPNSPASGH
jgi:hypothetical protein